MLSADEDSKDKRTRKVMSLLQKVEALDTLYGGMIIGMVTCKYDVNNLTIGFNRNNEDKIRGSVKTSALLSKKISCESYHCSFLEKMK
jgi:hypothetical protein